MGPLGALRLSRLNLSYPTLLRTKSVWPGTGPRGSHTFSRVVTASPRRKESHCNGLGTSNWNGKGTEGKRNSEVGCHHAKNSPGILDCALRFSQPSGYAVSIGHGVAIPIQRVRIILLACSFSCHILAMMGTAPFHVPI